MWGLGLAVMGSSARANHAQGGRPGSINYVEGNACIGTQDLGPASPGSVVLERGQTLSTEAGKVEMLSTPGVFLRVAEHSAVTMVSPGLADTEVAVEQGRVAIERS